MNKKALFTGAIAILVMFAVLPAANAVVLDPYWCPAGNSTAVKNLYAQYNLTYQTCGDGLIETPIMKKYNVSYSGIFNVLKNKPDSKLTWGETYFLASTYSGMANTYSTTTNNHTIVYSQKQQIKYSQKALHYANLMIQKENTPQSRTLAYDVMAYAADGMNGVTGNPAWLQKEIYFDIKSMENNPDGIVNTGWSNWENNSGLAGIQSPITRLLEAGYTVPPVALNFPWKASVAANAGKIHTMGDLNRLGFEQWKQNYITPLINEKAPLSMRIAENIPIIKNNPGLVNLLGLHGYIIFSMFGIFGLFLIGIGLVVLVLKRRRNNRYY